MTDEVLTIKLKALGGENRKLKRQVVEMSQALKDEYDDKMSLLQDYKHAKGQTEHFKKLYQSQGKNMRIVEKLQAYYNKENCRLMAIQEMEYDDSPGNYDEEYHLETIREILGEKA